MAYHWSPEIDEVMAGDQVVALAYVTPASGVVITPVTNFGIRDREAGTVTVNSSVGAWKKLDRIRRNAHVALAFHTRQHGLSDRPEYLLAQGRATLSAPIPDYPSTIAEQWDRFDRWSDVHPLWKRWQRIYALRVEVRVAVERLVVCPDLACARHRQVQGTALPDGPLESQVPPARGTEPRINHQRAARRAARLPNVLLGWVGGDGFPVVIPVGLRHATDRGIELSCASDLLPPGARRAGLTAHSFAPRVIGQEQRVHTGWLDADGPESGAVYAPHTDASYRFPTSEATYRLVSGAATRWRYRQGRRAGLLSE